MLIDSCFIGLYLFLQVQYPLSFVSIKFKHFFIFGCGKFIVHNVLILFNSSFSGGPLMNITVWIFLRLHFYSPNNADDIIKDCPFFEATEVDLFVCEIPILFILILNTFFLIWIMVVSSQYF